MNINASVPNFLLLHQIKLHVPIAVAVTTKRAALPERFIFPQVQSDFMRSAILPFLQNKNASFGLTFKHALFTWLGCCRVNLIAPLALLLPAYSYPVVK